MLRIVHIARELWATQEAAVKPESGPLRAVHLPRHKWTTPRLQRNLLRGPEVPGNVDDYEHCNVFIRHDVCTS